MAGYSVLVSRAPLAADSSALTGAQWAVAQAVARGLSDREIADSLHVSVTTVHEHVAALHELLRGVSDPFAPWGDHARSTRGRRHHTRLTAALRRLANRPAWSRCSFAGCAARSSS